MSTEWRDLLTFLATPGVLGIFAWVLYRFFRSAVAAHASAASAHAAATEAERRNADAWKAAYDAQVKRSDERDAQVAHILAAIKTATASTPTTGLPT